MFDLKVAVVGLGYVGLPLAVEFAKKFKTIGFDISVDKVNNLKSFNDPSKSVAYEDLKSSDNLEFYSDPQSISSADVIIIAVPTPVDVAHVPDFAPLVAASNTVAKYMKMGATVVYESTVYPGATEEICIPILEESSGLKWKEHFNVGYSPERVNPGDTVRTLTKIIKVVSGDNLETLEKLSWLYGEIIEAGIHKVSTIKVAEASKVIENTQRDLNIALMNELAIVFNQIGIDTTEVLDAAGTKWNFLPFRPGLVGGHCIGVDPYYLTHKAEMLGYHPQVILAGRRINDGMAKFIAETTIQNMINLGGCAKGDTVIILGFTFKENCPDVRNTKVADLILFLKGYGLNVLIHDPIADPDEVRHEYGLELTSWNVLPKNARAVIAAVSHSEYLNKPLDDILNLLGSKSVFIDVKSVYDIKAIESAGHVTWRL